MTTPTPSPARVMTSRRTGPSAPTLWCAAVVLALVAVACTGRGASDGGGTAGPTSAQTTTSSAPTAPTTVAADRVVHVTETFVDPSRPTVAAGEQLAPDRTLVTEIYLPPGDAPAPLLVFSHGLNGHPRKFTELLTAWARAGFAVAAPAFPLTNDEIGRPADVADYTNQPADVSFVIDRVLELAAADSGPLAGRIDPERIGAAGLSLGAGTTYGLVFHPCCRDERIDAAMIMAGLRFPFEGGELDLSGVPVMFLHGTGDPALPYEDTAEAYAVAAPPKIFVTLVDGGHAPPFEDSPSPFDELVPEITTDFWRWTLGGDEPALERLRGAGVPGLVEIRVEPAGG